MLTLIGTLLGGVFRLLPELFKFLDAKNDRAHELAMLDKQIEADKLKAQQAVDLTHAQTEGAATIEDIKALAVAVQAQATHVQRVPQGLARANGHYPAGVESEG